MTKFFIKISEIRNGWANITSENGVENITILVSYILIPIQDVKCA